MELYYHIVSIFFTIIHFGKKSISFKIVLFHVECGEKLAVHFSWDYVSNVSNFHCLLVNFL